MIAQLSVARQHRRASHTQNGTHKSLVEDLNVAVSKKRSTKLCVQMGGV